MTSYTGSALIDLVSAISPLQVWLQPAIAVSPFTNLPNLSGEI